MQRNSGLHGRPYTILVGSLEYTACTILSIGVHRFAIIQFRNGNPESQCVGFFSERSDAVCTTVNMFSVFFLQGFSAEREHDHAHGVWL